MSRSGFLALPYLPSPVRLLGNLGNLVMVWEDRRRMRTSLGRLDAHMLRDIGIDAGHATQEALKPFWRA